MSGETPESGRGELSCAGKTWAAEKDLRGGWVHLGNSPEEQLLHEL